MRLRKLFFAPYGRDHDFKRAQTFCNYISRYSNGILQQFGPDTYRFPHRTFQEYLAARRLIADEDWEDEKNEFIIRAMRYLDSGPQWREVVLLAISQYSVISNQLIPAAVLVEELLTRHWQHTPNWAHDVILAGEILAEVGKERLLRLGKHKARLWKETVTALTRLLRLRADGTMLLDPVSRIKAGNILSLLGDPRLGVCCPEPDWCLIPAGKSLIGSTDADSDAFSDEKPQCVIDLSAFYIGRYPVTNAPWKCFVEDGGYAERRWWSKAGRQACPHEKWINPRGDELCVRIANHPVVGITWYEASAYCRWLSARLGYEVRLPSKAEWEKAARGTVGWIYPWGNMWDPSKANVEHTVGATTPVGCYPDGFSPYGVMDMSGNVLEWTATPWTDDYRESDRTRVAMSETDTAAQPTYRWPEDEDEKRHVVCGGAWNLSRRSARCAYQLWRPLRSYNNNLGLRVATTDMRRIDETNS